AQPPPLTAVDRRKLVEMDHAVRDAVHCPIEALGREVVEHDDSRVVTGEIVLWREDLATIAQRALRQQANFGEAVDHYTLRLDPFDRVEDAPHGLAELEVGR